MPSEVFFSRANDGIQDVAFIKENEIYYLSSRDEATFDSFAVAVVNELFEDNQSISFEADNVDWAAMAVKNIFHTDSIETFDTWVYKK